MLRGINLVASHLPDVAFASPLEPGVCCVTGEETLTVPAKDVIQKTFNDIDELAAPTTGRVGIAAAKVLTYAIERDGMRPKFPLRQSLWLCTPRGIEYLKRQDARVHVLRGVHEYPWCGYVTTSYKKHGALRAPLNTEGSQRWLFETTVVDCSDRGRVKAWWKRLRAAQDAGISRSAMETLDMPLGIVRKIGVRVWLDFVVWANDKSQAPLYSFLVYLLPSQDELKNGYEEVVCG